MKAIINNNDYIIAVEMYDYRIVYGIVISEKMARLIIESYNFEEGVKAISVFKVIDNKKISEKIEIGHLIGTCGLDIIVSLFPKIGW